MQFVPIADVVINAGGVVMLNPGRTIRVRIRIGLVLLALFGLILITGKTVSQAAMVQSPRLQQTLVAKLLSPQRWQKGIYDSGPLEGNPLGANFTYAYTTPKNAIMTAKWLRKMGLKKGSKVIAGRFAADAYGYSANQLANALIKAANNAKKQQAMVGFATEFGGYPWNPIASVWTNPEDYFNSM